MSETVCITGGTGMIGSSLSNSLTKNDYHISILSRSIKKKEGVSFYFWDINNQKIDIAAIKNATHIIHLAGAGVAEKRWSDERKKELRYSRIKSAELLFKTIQGLKTKPKTIISASAIGAYGHDTGGVLVDEERIKPVDDFLATLTRDWEEEVRKFTQIGIRTVIFRIGVVLSQEGGALPRMILPVKYGIGSPLGTGEQYISWIHINDLIRMMVYAIENERMSGIFNAVAPHPLTNKEFMKEIATVLKKPMFLPNIPGFILRLALGEMASIVIGGNRVSSRKIETSGFKFQYKYLREALRDLLK